MLVDQQPTPVVTGKQRDIFNWILAYAQEHLYQPSYREICAHFGFASSNSVNLHLSALRKKGLICVPGGSSRSIEFIRRTPIADTPKSKK